MKKSLVVLFTIFLIACNNGDAPPEGIISEEKMALMLADVHIIESRVSKMGLLSLDSSTIVSEKLKADLFKQNKTDSSTYNKSYKFYSTHPEYLERIYKEVIVELEKREKKKDYRGL